jgi:hypothetical protein
LRRRVRLSPEELLVGAETGHVADGVAVSGGQVRLVGGVGRRVGEAFVGDEHLGAGVGDDPRDLGADEVVVDGDEVETRLGGGEIGGDEFRAVRQDDGERGDAFEARRAQPVPAVQLLPAGSVSTVRPGSAAACAQKPFPAGTEASTGASVMTRSFRRCG